MPDSEKNLPYWLIWLLSRPFLLMTAALILAVGIPAGLAVYLDQRLTQISDSALNDFHRPPGEPSGASPGVLPRKILVGQTVYVPLYSHVYQANGERLMLAGTLSIRNTDPQHGFTLSEVRYYDTEGKLVRDFVETPLTLKPLGSTDFFIKESDAAGGSGANFLVEWVSEHPVQEPVIEAVMVGRKDGGLAAFSRSGVVIKQFRDSTTEN